MRALAFAFGLLWASCAHAQHTNPQLGDIWLYFGPTLGAGWGENPLTSSIPNNTVLGNISGTAAPAGPLTATQLTTLCNVFTSSSKGCVPASGGSASTFLNGAGGFTTPAGTGITQLIGDVTAGPGSGSVSTTLANTAVTPGSYTSTNLTVDSKGRITAAANGSSGGITGSGIINTVAKFTGTTAVGNSDITDDGTTITAAVPGTLGTELLSNPTFVANSIDWTLGDCSTWSSGQFVTTYDGICLDASVSTTVNTVAGSIYRVTVPFTISGDQNYIYLTNNAVRSVASSGPTQTFTFAAKFTGADTVSFDLYDYNTGAVRTITGPVSIKEVTLADAPFAVMPLENAFDNGVLGRFSRSAFYVDRLRNIAVSAMGTSGMALTAENGSIRLAANGDGSGGTPGLVNITAVGLGSTATLVADSITLTGAGGALATKLVGALHLGNTVGTASRAELLFEEIAASGTAPGAATAKIAAVAGTDAGTCKLIMYAGTSTTPITIIDNVGAGC